MATSKKKATKKVAKKTATEEVQPVSLDDLESEFQKSAPAAELVARAAAAHDEAVDPPSGIKVVSDHNFLNDDPSDILPHLRRAKIEHEPEKYHYRWGSTSQRMYNKRRAQGYEPIPGVRKGDQVGMRLPMELKQAKEAQIENKRKLFETGESAKFDSEVRRQDGIPFDGPKSLSDGLK